MFTMGAETEHFRIKHSRNDGGEVVLPRIHPHGALASPLYGSEKLCERANE